MQQESRIAQTQPEHTAQGARPTRPKGRYIPALDGIRTLAVAAVVLYHLNVPWAQGGMLGVTVFFVLSGYLITHLLVAEVGATGTIDLKGFWIRRLRRLLPLTVTVIVATACLCTVFNHVMLTKMRSDILPSLFFFNNWWQILHQVSYFNNVGDPSPLTHFWSLAIEEQFYLVWPIALMAAVRAGAGRPAVRRATLALACLSALAMAVLYSPAVDPSRVYYGTDTRAFSLMFGAWLALIPQRRLSAAVVWRRIAGLAGRLDRKAAEPAGTEGPALAAPAPAWFGSVPEPLRRAPLDILGVLGFAGLFLMCGLTNGYDAFAYRGGTLAATLLATALIGACSRPESLIARFFALKPFVWLGKRSYGIYLWHYPLLLLMNPASNVDAAPWWAYAVQIAIVVAVSALSYRFIETPFRYGALGAFIRHVREGGKAAAVSTLRGRAVPVAACAVAVVFAFGGIVFVPDTSALSAEGAALLQGGSGSASASASPQGSAAQAQDRQVSAEAAPSTDNGGFPEGSYDILMVGDSVSLRLVPYFEKTFPHGHIDAMKNRQFDAGRKVYEGYLDQNLAGKIAVFALGTNGPVNDAMIDSVMADTGDKRVVVFVNTRAPESWISQTNQAIARAKERYSNVRVVDWYSHSAGRNDLFDGDGTHLSEKGAQEYTNLIYETVKGVLPLHPEDYADTPAVGAAKTAAEAAVKGIASIS